MGRGRIKKQQMCERALQIWSALFCEIRFFKTAMLSNMDLANPESTQKPLFIRTSASLTTMIRPERPPYSKTRKTDRGFQKKAIFRVVTSIDSDQPGGQNKDFWPI